MSGVCNGTTNGGPYLFATPAPFPIALPASCLTPPSLTPLSLSAQAVTQETSTAQGMQGFSSVGEFQQLGTAGENWLTAGTLSSVAAAQNLVYTLGTVGPSYGTTPYNMTYNGQYAQLVNATASQLNQSNATLALIRTGAATLLANSGRAFLGSTFT